MSAAAKPPAANRHLDSFHRLENRSVEFPSMVERPHVLADRAVEHILGEAMRANGRCGFGSKASCTARRLSCRTGSLQPGRETSSAEPSRRHVRGVAAGGPSRAGKNEGCSGMPSRASCTEGGPWKVYRSLCGFRRRQEEARSRDRGRGAHGKSDFSARSRTARCRSSERSRDWRADTIGCIFVLKPGRRDTGFIGKSSARPRMHGGRSGSDPETVGRADQNEPARCGYAGAGCIGPAN